MIITLLLFSASNVFAENSYSAYKNTLANVYNLLITFPHSMIEDSCHTLTISFAKTSHFKNPPTYKGEYVLRLSGNSRVILPVMDHTEKEVANPLLSFNYFSTVNRTPLIEEWMLSNCDMPWGDWFQIKQTGVLIDAMDSIILQSKIDNQRTRDLKKKLNENANKLRSEYEKKWNRGKYCESTHSNVVYLARLPYKEKIGCNDETIQQLILRNGIECYGVEFYHALQHTCFDLLLIIDPDEISIEECLNDICNHLDFI